MAKIYDSYNSDNTYTNSYSPMDMHAYSYKLGDQLKEIEQIEAGRKADNLKPLMVRLDGKAFHTLTKGLTRPFDIRLSNLMIDTTAYLVTQTQALIGYTQSDEITLYYAYDNQTEYNKEYMFNGKYQKMCSILAGMASAYFSRELPSRIPEKNDTLGIFDCRVWNVDTYDLVYENFKWRQLDAIKNSISMAAQALFKHKELHGLNGNQKKQMLINVNKPWEDEPAFFKYGTFVFRKSVYLDLTPEQLKDIPEKHHPTEPIKRHIIETISTYISSIEQFNGLTKKD